LCYWQQVENFTKNTNLLIDIALTYKYESQLKYKSLCELPTEEQTKQLGNELVRENILPADLADKFVKRAV
jgi:hypothetical protein